MTSDEFGERGSTSSTRATNFVRPQPQNRKPAKSSNFSDALQIIILLLLAITGLAGLGLHRFYLGQHKKGLIFLAAIGFFLAVMFAAMSANIDSIGKPALACFLLVVLYGSIEAFVFALRRAFKTISSAIS